jgi:hypothetical protein
MSSLHRDKGATHNFSIMWKVREDSRNKRKAKRAWKWGARPPPWAPGLVAEPIRLHLTDPASTAFEDE